VTPGTRETKGQSAESAPKVRLRHSNDRSPGISRRRAGKGFSYVDHDGRRVRDDATLDRIRSLAIPPAWDDVWICPDPLGHLQATGHDARGRKQYRYHPQFRERRESAKYERLVAFARALPAIRRQVDRDLARQGLPREKVLAAVVRLLELTLIRVGNDEYRRLNRSFGLTTLRDRHATVRGSTVRFRFRGKSGRVHEVGLRDRRLATVIRRCRDLPGQELFQYEGEDGLPVDVRSDDVNEYLQAIAPDITAKDFRTWAGTVLAYRALRALDEPATATEAKRNVVSAIRDTADQLGNTAAVCRRSYVHPVVVEAYLDPRLRGALVGAAEAAGSPPAGTTRAEERAVVRLLERRLGRDAARVGPERANRPKRPKPKDRPKRQSAGR
jgi:DNA topoisomerase I